MIPTNKKVVTEQTSQNTNITNLQNNKVDKVSGKALSTNDFTNAYKTKIDNMFSLIYPVGSIYMSVNSTSPASLFGGTWVQLKDRFLLGAGDSYSNGTTGGEATHILTIGEMPSHNHTGNMYNNTDDLNFSGNNGRPAGADANTEATYTTNNTGSGQAHNNMPPYLVVFMWRRTA